MIADNDQAQIDAVSASLTKLGGFEVISTVTARETAIKQLSIAPDVMILNSEVLRGHTLSRLFIGTGKISPYESYLSPEKTIAR